MTTPTPSDQEIAEELTSVLRSEAERVTPEPALHQILARAHEAGPAKSIRRRGGGWLPVIGGVVATAGLAAAAIVIFAPDDQKTATEPAVSCAVEVRAGCPVDLAVWMQTSGTVPQVLSGGFTVKSEGNVGVDAVKTLLTEQPDRMVNPWAGALDEPRPVAQVNDVTQQGGVVTVDFDRPLNQLASLGDLAFGEPAVQQLVLTVQSALRTDDPVLITVDGKPAYEAFGYPLPGPIQADWSLVSGIRPESPAQGDTVSSQVTISGTASTSEGNVVLTITQDGQPVWHSVTTAGGSGDYMPFEFKVKLPPGDYTLKLAEPNTASGGESWADELAVVYIDFTVE
jgi:hypothetical protein